VDIVLGVSMTPTTVRMALVEGERADGRTVDHDVFDVGAIEGSANSTAPDQVISAILGTQQSALVGGHRLVATGVAWSDHDEAAALREGLAARGIEDVTLVSDLHAAGALAQAAGRAVGYDTTALMFVERDTATMSVVETHDGSIVKAVSQSLHSADALAVITELVTGLQASDAQPQGVFVIGSGVDVTSVKEHLEHLVSLPVNAPDDAAMALARGAALAAAAAPPFEATTTGLAYSQVPDGAAAFAPTQLRAVDAPLIDDGDLADETKRPFLLVGSTLTTIFVIGVVALVISLAVSIRPTADQRPSPGESVVVPSTVAPSSPAPAPPAVAQVQTPVVAPAPETIPAPVPVVQEAPEAAAPRQALTPPQAAAPAPQAVAPAPVVPAGVPPAPEVTPVAPAPAAPVYVPPEQPPVYVPPVVQLPLLPRQWFPHQQEGRWGDDEPQNPRWSPSQDPSWSPPPQQRQPVIEQPRQPSGPRIPFWPF